SLDRLFVGLPKGGAKTVYTNFAPRVGFAYDIRGDGKMALRGGAGVFFDREGTNTVNAGIRNPPINTSVTIQDGNIDQPGGSASAVPGVRSDQLYQIQRQEQL